MATNTAVVNPPTRSLPLHAVTYMKKLVNFNDANISTGVPFDASLPKSAQILFTTVNIITAFNAATTNVLTVGQNASNYNDIVASADVDETTVAQTMVQTGGKLVLSADATPYVKYTQTGTAATTGKALIVIAYTSDEKE